MRSFLYSNAGANQPIYSLPALDVDPYDHGHDDSLAPSIDCDNHVYARSLSNDCDADVCVHGPSTDCDAADGDADAYYAPHHPLSQVHQD